MKKTLFILFILLLPISFFIFHDKGNEYLKPYVATYLETKLEQNMSVEVQHLKIDYEYMELAAVLNDLTKIKAQGEVSLLSKTLNIDYTLKSDGFKTFDNKVDINGTVVGTFNKLQIQGEGETLKSHINYALSVENELINNINVNIDNADIASLLELVAQPAYANGKVDIDINIPTLKEINTKGKAKIVLHLTTLNEKVFKKELNINLPRKTVITANLDSKISAKNFGLEGNIKSNLASVKLLQANYNLESKELLTDYVLLVPKLSELMFLTQQKLHGKLEVKGKLLVKKDAFNVQGNSKSLGGETNFNFNGQKLSLEMQKVKISKFLHLIGEKPYATGKLMVDVKLSNLKNLTGAFKIKTGEAKTINKVLKEELNLNLGKAITFAFNSEGSIRSNIATIQSKLDADVLNYHSDDMRYEVKNKKLSSTYFLDVPKLSKLSGITGKNLKGSLSVNGTMNHDKRLELSGLTKSLGGEIDFKLLSDKLSMHISDVPVEKLMNVLDYPQLFKATIIGDFNYNLATRQGTFTSKLNKAQLLSNELTVLIKEIRGLDLTKERYNETEFNAMLDKKFIDINFKAKSKNALLELPTGRINKTTNTIDADYKVSVENKDITGKIQGNVSNPRITINASNFLQDKVISVITDNIPEDTLKDLGFGQIQPSAIKDTVENLFGDLFR